MLQLCTSALPGLWAGQWPCWHTAGLRFRQHSHLGFFSICMYPAERFKVVFLAEIPVIAAKFTGVAPAGWPSWARVSEQGLAGYEYTPQEYATSTLQNNTLSPASPCALPCLKLSISYLIVALLGIFVKEQALSCWWFPRHAQDCLHQSALDKEVF